jgi:molybdopterin-guanine dinucleotide biosynthesis protein A
MGGGGVDAVVPMRDGRDEPLVACYRRSVGRVATEVIAAGEHSLRAVLARIRVDRVAEHEWRELDPDGRSFLDVDTPHDLTAVRDLLTARAAATEDDEPAKQA